MWKRNSDLNFLRHTKICVLPTVFWSNFKWNSFVSFIGSPDCVHVALMFRYLLSSNITLILTDTGILHWHHPSGPTMALGLIQPLTETSTRNISWGIKAAGAQGWQPYHLHLPIVVKSRNLNLLEPSRPVQACNGITLPFNRHCLKLNCDPFLYPQM
jgi:hypothetical protein